MEEGRARVCVSLPLEIVKNLEAIARYDARSPASLLSKVLNMKAKKFLEKGITEKPKKKKKKKAEVSKPKNTAKKKKKK